VDERLPLFPLGTVLFPGAILPLHIFEERYRLLVRDLLKRPEPQRFGVVAIELGHEVGEGAARRLAGVGCTAVLKAVRPYGDGRFDIVTVGEQRFRVLDVDESAPYLRADVAPLPDEPGDDPNGPAQRASGLLHRYRDLLAATGVQVPELPDLPPDPVRLSYAVAGAIGVDRREKQRLLEAACATTRLTLEIDLLTRENRLLAALPTAPTSHFIGGDVHPN
jgi:Lon protease-like protein